MLLDKQRLIFLAITSSKNNAHASLQNWSTIHNAIRNGFALAPALSTAGYVLPNTTVDMEPNLYLPLTLTLVRPLLDPYPAPPPLASHGCTSHTVGADITISSLPPRPLINPNSPDVLQIITANADTHLQNYERKKGRTNKTDASTSIITCGDTLIGDLLHRNMLLIPFAMDPLGRFGPLLQNFIFGQHSAPQLRFPPSRPNATQMYNKLLQYPSPKGILLLANHGHNIQNAASTDTHILHPLLLSPLYNLLESL